MQKRAIVLGCGLVGSAMVRDLADDPVFAVTAADINEETLRKIATRARVDTRLVDFGDPGQVRSAVQDFDVALGALPSRIGRQTLAAVIEAGTPYCDISFMPEDALELDTLAKQHGTTAVVDCGVSPGLSNLCIGHAHSQLDTAERAVIYVGGVPKVRRWPYDYKAPYAPSDVIEVYTRPARLMEGGSIVEKPALSELELLDFPGAGTLEAFNTDGLRTLLKTVDIPNMKEKTLRYPGHSELMRVLGDTGFFDTIEIDVHGTAVRPLDLTAKLLSAKWRLEEGEEELTIMRVVVEGSTGGKHACYTYDLYDEYDRDSGIPSMARTTGFPCAAVARMLARGELREPGVLPPELLARREGFYDRLVRDLEDRGVKLTLRVE